MYEIYISYGVRSIIYIKWRMELYKIIERILKKDRQFRSSQEISEIVKQNALGEENSEKVNASKIRNIARQHPGVFQVVDEYVTLVENSTWKNIVTTYWAIVHYLKGYYSIADVQFIMAFLFYFKRKAAVCNFSFQEVEGLFQKKWSVRIEENCNPQELEFVEELRNIIGKARGRIGGEQINMLDSLELNDFSDFEYGAIFNYLVNLISLDSHNSPIIYTSCALKKMMVGLLAPERGKKIYNPVAGMGGLLIETLKITGDVRNIKGSEVKQRVALIGQMNLLLHGCHGAELKNENCFAELSDPEIYDQIIGDLPMDGILHEYFYEDLYWKFGLPIPKRGFGAFILFILAKLSGRGRAVVTVSEGFLFKQGKEREIRRFLVDQDWIEAVIGLPHGVLRPYTESKASLLILNKAKSPSMEGKIKFIEAEELGGDKSSIELNVEEIVAWMEKEETAAEVQIIKRQDILSDLNLSAKAYSVEQLTLNDMVENKRAVLLGELVSIKSGMTVDKKDMLAKGEVPVIKIENLSKDILDVYLNENQSFSWVDAALKYNSAFIEEECILIARVGDNLKPVYYKPSRKLPGIIIQSGIRALLPKKSVIDLEYLYYQLYTTSVIDQVAQKRHGTVMPTISMAALREVVIPYVDIAAQKEFVLTRKADIIATERAKVEERIKAMGYIEEKEQTESDIVRTLVHQLRPTLVTINSDVGKIKRIIARHALEELKEELRVCCTDPELAGLIKEAEDYTLGEIVEKVGHDTLKLSDVLTNVSKVMSFKLSPKDMETINLFSFFDNYIRDKRIENEDQYKLILTGESFEVMINRTSFKELIDQLILNAQKHGFAHCSLPVSERKIVFNLKRNKERKVAIIEYHNNGNPFKLTSEDFVKSFRKGQHSDGSGIGGSYIYRIVKAHQGGLHIHERLRNGFSITIEIPLTQNNSEHE